jgi:hypothetical protein
MMLTADRIRALFILLNSELERRDIRGEVYLAGGAVMCLVFNARPATIDVDALLVPAAELRAAASIVAAHEGLPEHWLNDAVKGFLSPAGGYETFEDLSHLRIYVPHAGYLLAMKCLALRLGEESQDLEDVRVLIRVLGVRESGEVESILARYYPFDRYPAKARYVIEELLREEIGDIQP